MGPKNKKGWVVDETLNAWFVKFLMVVVLVGLRDWDDMTLLSIHFQRFYLPALYRSRVGVVAHRNVQA